MQKVIVQIDWYTKIILTLIAVLLASLLVKSYLPSHIPEARASDILRQTTESEETKPGPLMMSKSRMLRSKVHAEGSSFLAEYLYLYALQNLSKETALEFIDKGYLLLRYPAGKEYAKLLVTVGREQAYQKYLSSETIEKALLSGRFGITALGVFP